MKSSCTTPLSLPLNANKWKGILHTSGVFKLPFLPHIPSIPFDLICAPFNPLMFQGVRYGWMRPIKVRSRFPVQV